MNTTPTRPRTIEHHAAFAVTTDNTRYRVSPLVTLDEAHNRFNRLDDPRFHDGQVYAIEGKAVKFFAVRSANDPDWNTATHAEVTAITLHANDFLTSSGKPLQAVRDYATRHGVKGQDGGWMRDADGNAITQGWFNYITGELNHLRRDYRVMDAVMAYKAGIRAPRAPRVAKPATRTVAGVKFVKTEAGWTTEDGKYTITHDDDFETECDCIHPMKVTQRDRDAYAAATQHERDFPRGYNYHAFMAIKEGRKGWQCPGDEIHYYAMWVGFATGGDVITRDDTVTDAMGHIVTYIETGQINA